jgi:hypothetical protein
MRCSGPLMRRGGGKVIMKKTVEGFKRLTLVTEGAAIALRDYLAEWEYAMHRAYFIAGEPYGPNRKGCQRWAREQMESQ